MRFLSRFCLLLVVCSAIELHKRIFQLYLGFLMMDFASLLNILTRTSELKGGFLVLGCFSPIFNVFGLFLMFGLGLKLLQCSWQGKGLIQFLCEIRGKSSDIKSGFCSKKGLDGVCDSKMKVCKYDTSEFLENSESTEKSNSLLIKKQLVNSTNGDSISDNGENDNFVEDEEPDVIALRRLVKIERHKAEIANAELEKERMASASSADEAMAMILRLQSEKSCIEIEANQHRRMSAQQQEYNQEVIRSLQWIITKYEYQTTLLEEKLNVLEQKLQQYMKSDDINQLMDQFEGFEFDESSWNFSLDSAMENDFEEVKSNSIEMDIPVL